MSTQASSKSSNFELALELIHNETQAKQGEQRLTLRSQQNTSQLRSTLAPKAEANLKTPTSTPSPTLPNPGGTSKGNSDSIPQNQNIIALIGLALCVQAKANSNFWSSLWQQASQSMMIAVKFAPIIGNAIRQQAQQQSDATKSDASQAKTTAIISFTSFGATCALGTVQASKAISSDADEEAVGIKSETTDATKDVDENIEDISENLDQNISEQKAAGEGSTVTNRSSGHCEKIDEKLTALEKKLSIPDDEVEGLSKEDIANNPAKCRENFTTRRARIQKEIDETNKSNSWWTKTKTFGKDSSSRFSKFSRYLNEGISKSVGSAQLVQMLNQGAVAANQATWQGRKATHEAQAGVYGATSKMCEQYAQFFTQSFSRAEDLRQGCQQNLDYAMNILKSAADTITQAVMSMFRA